jgi:NAD(P)-dependent dehydrogenase (short-subunit alcohol dehydrogenase family)
MTNSHKVLDQQVAIVTGAAGGIGRAIAERFAQEGAYVVVVDVKGDGAAAVAAAIEAAGGMALSVAADVSEEAQVAELFERTLQRWGSVDVLVNNASLTSTERHFLQADAQWWRRIIDVNLTSAFLCGQHAARLMARLSSGGATRAHRGNAAYDAAKGGIEALTRAMALDLAPYGVRVNALVPGSINTAGMDEATKAARGANIPLGRVGEAEELAGPAVFLASPDARYITGHCLVVDGGMLSQQRSASVDIFPLSRFPALEGQE